VKALLVRLEPVIWILFGGGMFVSALFYPALLLMFGLAAPLNALPPDALSFERALALAAHPIGRVLLAALIALPLWAAAHQVRHLAIDFGGLARDGWFGSLCYALALGGSVLAVLAVIRL
jgi:succinate dehydrogenase subunit D